MTAAVNVVLLTGGIFLLILLSLGLQPKAMAYVTGVMLLLSAILGSVFYGCGFSSVYAGNPAMALLRSVLAVFCMFLGRNEIKEIQDAPLLQTQLALFWVYLAHLMAIYATASAVITTIGTRAVRLMSLLLLQRSKVNLIYGANEDSVSFAKKLLDRRQGSIVFVDDGAGAGYANTILHMGSLLFGDEGARTPTASLLNRIGMRPGRRALFVYCLDENAANNLRFAQALKQLLERGGIAPSQTSLTVLLEDEAVGEALQASRQGGGLRYGYGSVLALERADLAARLAFRIYPPWENLLFDEKGRAKEDFEALIVGFGGTGQAVLRRLVMNGQFEGSRFHATVVSHDHRRLSGSFFYRYPALGEKYQIDFQEFDAKSIDMYDYLSRHSANLNYIVVCTGSDRENEEIEAGFRPFLAAIGCRAPIVICARSGIRRVSRSDGCLEETTLYSPEVLCGQALDAMAIAVNAKYHEGEGRAALEAWADCDYFSRMSCRAYADFLDAFLLAAHTEKEAAMDGAWPPEAETVENLSRMEHLRWCAFHYASGFDTMDRDTYARRAEQYLQEKREKGESALRIGKDMAGRRHACLIPWEELDELARREYAVTGRRVDYKAMDVDNILEIPAMLRAARRLERGDAT